MIARKLAAVLALPVLTLSSPAWALVIDENTSGGTTSGADTVIIGCRNFGQGWAAYVCVNDNYHQINSSCSLDEDVWVYGYTGGDNFKVIRTDGTSVRCNSGGSTAVWNDVPHNGYDIRLYGEAGNDIMEGDTGCTRLWGGPDNDEIHGYGACLISGGSGNDDVIAEGASVSTDDLYGDGGDDCLEDASGTWTTFDCGDGYDNYVNTPGAEANCNNVVEYCGFGLW